MTKWVTIKWVDSKVGMIKWGYLQQGNKQIDATVIAQVAWVIG